MQANNPYLVLHPSMTQVSRDWATATVMLLEGLQEYNTTLMTKFVEWCRDGHAPVLLASEWAWLVTHSLLREDNTLEERTRDLVNMTVSGDTAPFTIDGSML